MNSSDLVHIAYAVEESTSSFPTPSFDTLDLEEIQAAVDEFGLALIQHYSILSKYRN